MEMIVSETPWTDALNQKCADELNQDGVQIGDHYIAMREHAQQLEATLRKYAKHYAGHVGDDLKKAADLIGTLARPEGTVMRCVGWQDRSMMLDAPDGFRIECGADYRVERVPQERDG